MTTVIEIDERHDCFGKHEYLFRDVFKGTDEECLKCINRCAKKTIDYYYMIGFELGFIDIYDKTTLHVNLKKGSEEDSFECGSGYTEINLLVHVSLR